MLILCLPELLTVFAGFHLHIALEYRIEKLDVIESDPLADVRDGNIRLYKQSAGFLDSQLMEILSEAVAGDLAEKSAEIAFTEK